MAFCGKCGKEISEGTLCSDCAAKTQSSAGKLFQKYILDTRDTTSSYKKEEIEKDKVVCALAYIPILFWLPLVAGTKGSKYCKFHANNGLLLLIINIILSIVTAFIGIIPIVGGILGTVLGLVTLAYVIFGIVFTLKGKVKDLPFIGGINILS